MSEYIRKRKIDTNECPNIYSRPIYSNIRIYSSHSGMKAVVSLAGVTLYCHSLVPQVSVHSKLRDYFGIFLEWRIRLPDPQIGHQVYLGPIKIRLQSISSFLSDVGFPYNWLIFRINPSRHRDGGVIYCPTIKLRVIAALSPIIPTQLSHTAVYFPTQKLH